MNLNMRVVAVAIAVSATCLMSQPQGLAQMNWTQVPGYIDVQGRMTKMESSITEALAAGRLTQAQADTFKNSLKLIRDQDAKFRVDGKLSMLERIRITVDLDKLNLEIEKSLSERKVAVTDITGREADIEKLIQESFLSGRLTNLEATTFQKTLTDIKTKEQGLKQDGALSSSDLLTLSVDLDKISNDIAQSLRTRVISDPGLDSRKADLKKRIDESAAAQRMTAQQASLLNEELNRIIAREASFKTTGNGLDAEETLTLALELERLKGQVDRFQPQTVPDAVKGIDERQADIVKQINDAKALNKLTVQEVNDLTQEFHRIEALEAMFRADLSLSDSEILTLARDLNALKKRLDDASTKAQVPGLGERRTLLRKRILDAQARINPASAATDFLRELDRLDAKEQYLRADGSLDDTETLVIAQDLDSLSSRVEASIAALPSANVQRDKIEKKLNDALASGRLDPANADEFRQEFQRIAFLGDTFKGNDGLVDERELLALNKEYANLDSKLDKTMPALPDIDALQADLEKKVADGQAKKSLDAASVETARKELARIAGIEASFRASDASLAEWEAMALKRDLDKLSLNIDSMVKTVPVVTVDVSNASADTRGHWAQDYIAILQQRGTIGGFPDGTFKPDQGITRSQFAAIAVKALGLPSGGRDVEFKDLPKTHWAYKAICSASDAGLVGGFPDGSFRPEDKLTRAQALVILAKALGDRQADASVLDRYKDGNTVAAWALPSVAKAAKSGIIVNHPDPYSIRPADLATRAEVAALTYQTMSNLGQKLPPLRIGLEASAE